jgi:hypothetical protein
MKHYSEQYLDKVYAALVEAMVKCISDMNSLHDRELQDEIIVWRKVSTEAWKVTDFYKHCFDGGYFHSAGALLTAITAAASCGSPDYSESWEAAKFENLDENLEPLLKIYDEKPVEVAESSYVIRSAGNGKWCLCRSKWRLARDEIEVTKHEERAAAWSEKYRLIKEKRTLVAAKEKLIAEMDSAIKQKDYMLSGPAF